MYASKLSRAVSGAARVQTTRAARALFSTASPSLSTASSRLSAFAATRAARAAPAAARGAIDWTIDVASPVPPPGDLPALRVKAAKETDRLAEVVQAKAFATWLAAQTATADPAAKARIEALGLSNEDIKVGLKAAMMTFLLHVEVRSLTTVHFHDCDFYLDRFSLYLIIFYLFIS